MWEVSTGYCIKTLQGHDDWVRTIDISEDGASLVSGGNDQVCGSAKTASSFNTNEIKTVRIWNLATGECAHVFRGHEHVVETVCFVPAAALDHLKEYLQTLNGAQPARDLKPGAMVLSGSRDRSIRLWDLTT